MKCTLTFSDCFFLWGGLFFGGRVVWKIYVTLENWQRLSDIFFSLLEVEVGLGGGVGWKHILWNCLVLLVPPFSLSSPAAVRWTSLSRGRLPCAVRHRAPGGLCKTSGNCECVQFWLQRHYSGFAGALCFSAYKGAVFFLLATVLFVNALGHMFDMFSFFGLSDLPCCWCLHVSLWIPFL